MEPEGSLPHSQVPNTCPYPEPDQSTHVYFIMILQLTERNVPDSTTKLRHTQTSNYCPSVPHTTQHCTTVGTHDITTYFHQVPQKQNTNFDAANLTVLVGVAETDNNVNCQLGAPITAQNNPNHSVRSVLLCSLPDNFTTTPAPNLSGQRTANPPQIHMSVAPKHLHKRHADVMFV
jgi:hypothetical protein